ncbi:MAG: beta-ketoacyl synthase N-terminal-like domain-containing protein, partial [Succinivibrionaceae bacterium]|nr:beta-ketoacyl synthase N-terminal-like domain-containing protein [Succinivibrionaceae bacterium]
MIYLSGLNAVSTLGTTQTEVLATLSHQGPSKLVTESGFLPDKAVATLGHVPLPNVKGELRNLTLIKRCLDNMSQVIETVKKEVSPERIGIVIGTSTSALTDVELESQITETGTMKFDPRVYEIGIISEYVRNLIGGRGPSYTVATACSSSARAILSARNLILSGLCDAVIAGGTDSLSKVTVSGFHALGALDPKPARPFASDRAGINIGEGAGLCVVANRPLAPQAIKLLGGGASTDAYHVSAPDPTASGALLAVQAAL